MVMVHLRNSCKGSIMFLPSRILLFCLLFVEIYTRDLEDVIGKGSWTWNKGAKFTFGGIIFGYKGKVYDLSNRNCRGGLFFKEALQLDFLCLEGYFLKRSSCSSHGEEIVAAKEYVCTKDNERPTVKLLVSLAEEELPNEHTIIFYDDKDKLTNFRKYNLAWGLRGVYNASRETAAPNMIVTNPHKTPEYQIGNICYSGMNKQQGAAFKMDVKGDFIPKRADLPLISRPCNPKSIKVALKDGKKFPVTTGIPPIPSEKFRGSIIGVMGNVDGENPVGGDYDDEDKVYIDFVSDDDEDVNPATGFPIKTHINFPKESDLNSFTAPSKGPYIDFPDSGSKGPTGLPIPTHINFPDSSSSGPNRLPIPTHINFPASGSKGPTGLPIPTHINFPASGSKGPTGLPIPTHINFPDSGSKGPTGLPIPTHISLDNTTPRNSDKLPSQTHIGFETTDNPNAVYIDFVSDGEDDDEDLEDPTSFPGLVGSRPKEDGNGGDGKDGGDGTGTGPDRGKPGDPDMGGTGEDKGDPNRVESNFEYPVNVKPQVQLASSVKYLDPLFEEDIVLATYALENIQGTNSSTSDSSLKVISSLETPDTMWYSILKDSVDIVKKLAPDNLIPDDFFTDALKMFSFIFRNIEDDNDLLKQEDLTFISAKLKTCADTVETPVISTTTDCPAMFDYFSPSGNNETQLRYNNDPPTINRFHSKANDIIVEAMWDVVDIVYTKCLKDFEDDLGKHSRMIVYMTETVFLSDRVQARWFRNPEPISVFESIFPYGNLDILMYNYDKLRAVNHYGKLVDIWLKKPRSVINYNTHREDQWQKERSKLKEMGERRNSAPATYKKRNRVKVFQQRNSIQESEEWSRKRKRRQVDNNDIETPIVKNWNDPKKLKVSKAKIHTWNDIDAYCIQLLKTPLMGYKQGARIVQYGGLTPSIEDFTNNKMC